MRGPHPISQRTREPHPGFPGEEGIPPRSPAHPPAHLRISLARPPRCLPQGGSALACPTNFGLAGPAPDHMGNSLKQTSFSIYIYIYIYFHLSRCLSIHPHIRQTYMSARARAHTRPCWSCFSGEPRPIHSASPDFIKFYRHTAASIHPWPAFPGMLQYERRTTTKQHFLRTEFTKKTRIEH